MLNDPRQNKSNWFRRPDETELDDKARAENFGRDTDKAIVDESILKPTRKRPSRRIKIIHARKRGKAIFAAIVFAAAVSAMVLYLVLNKWAVDMPCDWCRKRPSVAFETSDGSEAYVCRDCMKTCMICEKKRAVKHYENLAGMIVFVCEDCYREISQE